MKGVSKLVGDVATSQNAIATGEVDILVGGGEWVTAGLAKDNPALDFTLPKEGASSGRKRSAYLRRVRKRTPRSNSFSTS